MIQEKMELEEKIRNKVKKVMGEELKIMSILSGQAFEIHPMIIDSILVGVIAGLVHAGKLIIKEESV